MVRRYHLIFSYSLFRLKIRHVKKNWTKVDHTRVVETKSDVTVGKGWVTWWSPEVLIYLFVPQKRSNPLLAHDVTVPSHSSYTVWQALIWLADLWSVPARINHKVDKLHASRQKYDYGKPDCCKLCNASQSYWTLLYLSGIYIRRVVCRCETSNN